MPPNKSQNQPYSAQNIRHFSAREHVRLRPGMYVGGTDKRAIHLMLWQAVDEAMYESLQFPTLNEIAITFLSDVRMRVTDNGLGIPTESHQSGKSVLEVYMTDYGLRRENYVVNGSNDLSGKLHAIHMHMMNALTSECVIESKYEGHLWRQAYEEGIPVTQVEQVRLLAEGESTGTSITFAPDFSIMEANVFDYDLIVERCRELAYLLPHVTFRVEREDEFIEPAAFHYPNGLADWINEVNQGITVLHPPLSKHVAGEYPDKHGRTIPMEVDVAFQFRALEAGRIKSYANTIHTPEGGEHVDGLEAALLSAIYGDAHKDLIDPLHGLVAAVHVHHPDPQFESQTKIKLLNPEAKAAVEDCVRELFAEHMDVQAQLQGYFRV